jgi:hypothetical protein
MHRKLPLTTAKILAIRGLSAPSGHEFVVTVMHYDGTGDSVPRCEIFVVGDSGRDVLDRRTGWAASPVE